MFTEEVTNAFEEYEHLKVDVKKAEVRMKELQPLLMENIEDNQEVEGKAGVFYVQSRTKWEYTDKVKQATKNLKTLKGDEEATGDAIPTQSSTLYYRADKEESEKIPG